MKNEIWLPTLVKNSTVFDITFFCHNFTLCKSVKSSLMLCLHIIYSHVMLMNLSTDDERIKYKLEKQKYIKLLSVLQGN